MRTHLHLSPGGEIDTQGDGALSKETFTHPSHAPLPSPHLWGASGHHGHLLNALPPRQVPRKSWCPGESEIQTVMAVRRRVVYNARHGFRCNSKTMSLFFLMGGGRQGKALASLLYHPGAWV